MDGKGILLIYENVKECPKSIGLRIIFKNILWENDKAINFIDNFYFYIFLIKVISKLSWYDLLRIVLKTSINVILIY